MKKETARILIDSLTDLLPYAEDLLALEKVGEPSGFKKGIVSKHVMAARTALKKANLEMDRTENMSN